jgi:DNA-binding transcriptional LysR family regulator
MWGGLAIYKTGIICTITFEELDMSSDPGTPTLDQLRVFLTVVDAGSFAGAARRLGRATSVISYAIGNLEAQLGVSLFDREATRKPQLTGAGRTVLSEARTITNGINGLRAKVRGLLQGLEAEIHLVLDVMLPAWRVVDALKAFRTEFPTVSLRLYVEALGAVRQMVLNRAATIGICGPLDVEVAGLERVGVGSVEMVPVAAPDHPLALAGRNAPGAGRDHIQLVLTDRSPLTQGQDLGVIGTQTWRLADLSSKHMLLKEGIGWGYMPEPMVREDIEAGRLIRLDMPEYKDAFIRLHAIYRTDVPPGPAGSWLIARFVAQAEGAADAATRRAILPASHDRRKSSARAR